MPIDAFEVRKDSGTRRKTCHECMKAWKRQHADKKARDAGKKQRPLGLLPLVGRSKKCFICKGSKDLSLFNIRSDSPDGYNNQCTECKKAYLNEYYRALTAGEREVRVPPEITAEGKICTECDTMKPLCEYTVRKDTPHGYKYSCHSCRRKAYNAWHKQHLAECEDFAIRTKTVGMLHSGLIKQGAPSAFLPTTGVSVLFFRGWFEYLFELDGELTWENYGLDKLWCVFCYRRFKMSQLPKLHRVCRSNDHVVALSKFDLTDPKEFQLAFNWKNTQPLRDNLQKGAKFRPEEYEQHVIKVKQFIEENNLPETEYQGLTEMADWLRDKLGYGNNLTDTMDDPQPSS